jgi:hypothetical protein
MSDPRARYLRVVSGGTSITHGQMLPAAREPVVAFVITLIVIVCS